MGENDYGEKHAFACCVRGGKSPIWRGVKALTNGSECASEKPRPVHASPTGKIIRLFCLDSFSLTGIICTLTKEIDMRTVMQLGINENHMVDVRLIAGLMGRQVKTVVKWLDANNLNAVEVREEMRKDWNDPTNPEGRMKWVNMCGKKKS